MLEVGDIVFNYASAGIGCRIPRLVLIIEIGEWLDGGLLPIRGKLISFYPSERDSANNYMNVGWSFTYGYNVDNLSKHFGDIPSDLKIDDVFKGALKDFLRKEALCK